MKTLEKTAAPASPTTPDSLTQIFEVCARGPRCQVGVDDDDRLYMSPGENSACECVSDAAALRMYAAAMDMDTFITTGGGFSDWLVRIADQLEGGAR